MKADLNESSGASACQHARTRLIAKDQDAEYVECLDCGEILEGEELAPEKSPEKNESDGSPGTLSANGSLSDA